MIGLARKPLFISCQQDRKWE